MRASLEEEIRAAVGQTVPGVAVVIVGAEGVRAHAAIGDANLGSSTNMTTEMVIPWFSMTKIATATTAVRLAEQGALDLDAPILPLVPAVSSLRPKKWAARITARHLLQHAGGLPNPIPVRWIHRPDHPGPDPDAFLTRMLKKHRKLGFEPGTRSSYSNVGTLILGAAIARAAERRFEDAVHQQVLGPLEMVSTGFSFAADVPAATGYHPRWSPTRLLLPRWVRGRSSGSWLGLERFVLDGAAYGGLIGTAEDAGRFLRMHLRDGELEGTRLISGGSAAEMRKIDMQGKRYDLGLGWFTPTDQRRTQPAFVEHLGGGAGFFNVMRMYPALGVGVVVMGNATSYDIDAVARLAFRWSDG